MPNRYKSARVFEDRTPRLLIPNITTLAATIGVNFLSEVSGFEDPKYGGVFKKAPPFTSDTQNKIGNAYSLLDDALAWLSVGFGITEIEMQRSYAMPLSKGIGSVGEIIHLIGAKQEKIGIKFTTDEYPGALAYVIRRILNAVIENADIVYIIDDMFIAVPCLITDFKLKKEGKLRGAVIGEMNLISLTTGVNPITNITNGVLANTSAKLKLAMGAVAIGTVGALTVKPGLKWIERLLRDITTGV